MKRRLEQLGKNNKKINKRDQDNTTALHYAVRYGHMHIVQLLLESGAGRKQMNFQFFARGLLKVSKFCYKLLCFITFQVNGKIDDGFACTPP